MTSGEVREADSRPRSAEYLESAEKLPIFRRRYIVGTLTNIPAWLLLNLWWMSTANFKPKTAAAASRGFLATARLSCFFSRCHWLTAAQFAKVDDNVYLQCVLFSWTIITESPQYISFVKRHNINIQCLAGQLNFLISAQLLYTQKLFQQNNLHKVFYYHRTSV